VWVAVSVAVAVGFGVTALARLTASADAADNVLSCGSVITEDTVLTHDLLDCEDGLRVAAPNVTLDLGGHELVGQGQGSGVYIEAEGVVVENGVIRGFGWGVRVSSASGTVVNDLDLASNGWGIEAWFSNGLHLARNTIHNNRSGVGIFFSADNQIVGNRLLNNQEWGIASYRAGVLADSNLVMRNGSGGIHVDSGRSVLTNNSSSRNAGDGIAVTDEICGELQFYSVGSNVADGNQRLGINVQQLKGCPPGSDPLGALDAGGDVARHNGDSRECTIVVCNRSRGQASRFWAAGSSAG
jgi:hypothetical protein